MFYRTNQPIGLDSRILVMLQQGMTLIKLTWHCTVPGRMGSFAWYFLLFRRSRPSPYRNFELSSSQNHICSNWIRPRECRFAKHGKLLGCVRSYLFRTSKETGKPCLLYGNRRWSNGRSTCYRFGPWSLACL